MPNSSVARKRRPVDVLFGDKSAAYPHYVIESPQPVTTVSPPPPELTLLPPHPPMPPPAPVTPPDAPPPHAAPAEAAVPEPEPTAAPPPVADEKPAPSPAPTAPRLAATGEDRISQLYDDVRMQLGDTREVTKECMDLLLKARIAYTEGDYATAEFYAESVDARLTQCALSQQSSRRPIVWVIWLWNLAVVFASAGTIVATYTTNLTLFGLAVAPEALLVMRAAAWGIVGAVFGTMANLVRSVHYREYDPANELGYLARPFVGAELGFILFILWQTVTVAISLVIGEVHISAVFLYIFAASAGFGIDTLTQSFRNFLGREP